MKKLNDEYYLLGFAWEDADVLEEGLRISKPFRMKKVLDDVAASLGAQVFSKPGRSVLSVGDRSLREFFAEKRSRKMPVITSECAWSFVCGVFDGYGEIAAIPENPRIMVRMGSAEVVDYVSRLWEAKTPHVDRVQAFGYKALDLCGRMYSGGATLWDSKKFEQFLDLLNWTPPRGWARDIKFGYHKLESSAVPPSKARVTDSGYDISAISMSKLRGNIYKAETGLAVRPAPGYYFDLIGRSSLPQKGWSLLQGVGVIDRSFTGELVMHLEKIDEQEMPKLPFRCAQLIPRPIVHSDFVEMAIEETDRGSRGFGSTD